VQATALDHYSRCGFMALGASRWKLRDLRDPSLELWADVKGILLHKAVELLIVSFSAGHKLSLSASEAIEQAWLEKKPKGLTGGQRIENLIKRKLEKVLESFLFDEKIYRERSGAKVHDLESIKLELKLKGGVIRGRPDRIDETEDGSGYFVIDYKTTSALPSGFDMVENGYRLQLPFYALALDQIARMKTKETLGAQFIELTRNGVRSKGIFFTQSNGKESGKLTRVRANSKSLFAAEPNEVWKKAQFQIENHFESLVSGLHTANPKQETDCRLCSYSDLCGKRRL
jgi:RecB family exonuclease